MAQSSSCSQMEMRLDCRSIYSRELPPRTKRTNEQASPRMSQGAAAGGVRRPRSAARRRRFTWKLRGEWRHSCAQTPGVLSGKTAEPRGNYSGVFLLPHGDVKVTELCSFKSGPTFVEERRLLLLLRAKKRAEKVKYTPGKVVKSRVKMSPRLFFCLDVKPNTAKHHFCIPRRRVMLLNSRTNSPGAETTRRLRTDEI